MKLSCSNFGVRLLWYGWMALAAGLWPLAAGPLPAALGPAPVAAPPPATNVNGTLSLRARLAEARVRLAAEGDLSLSNAPVGVSAEDILTRRTGMHRLVRLYEQQLDSQVAVDKLRARREEVVREAKAWTRFTDPPPYSILLVDRLRDELQIERHQIQRVTEAEAMLQRLADESQSQLAQAEERLRQLNEQLESIRQPLLAARLSWQREMERLRSQVAAASVAVLDLERRLGEETRLISRSRLEVLPRQLTVAMAGARFVQGDLDVVIRQNEFQRVQLEQELAEARTNQATALRDLEAVRAEAAAAAGSARTAEVVAAREAQWETADTAVAMLRLMLEGLSLERTMWELRFAAHDSRSVGTLRDSQRRLDGVAGRLALWRGYTQGQLEVVLGQAQVQEARWRGLALDSDVRPLARERLDALRERERLLRRVAGSLDRAGQLTQHWQEGLQAAIGRLPFTGRVRNLFSDARSFGNRLWNFEVFSAEDTITVDGQAITGRRSVTIGKIVMALFILVAGYWLTGLLSAWIEPLVVRRLRIETNQANLIRRWFRACLIASLVVISLVSVKIPLTIFAFAGGALAIGLGFGTQTMLKNLVSGLILLFERPFRVGDVLDVSGQRGTVSSIGLRASVLQLWDGTETLIPNSSLLEGNVTNWTYSNRRVRFSVAVGVAYNTDVRRVMHLLAEVAERHGVVEKDPKPQVLFTDFGDSTLAFELRFWIDITKANAPQVSSDLRLMIATVFAENGIVIDYPQRDVHLHAAQPIPVQVLPGGPLAASAARASQAAGPPP